MCAITDFESVHKNSLVRLSKKMRRGKASDQDQSEAIALLLEMGIANMTETRKLRQSVGEIDRRLWPEETLDQKMKQAVNDHCASCDKGNFLKTAFDWLLRRFIGK